MNDKICSKEQIDNIATELNAGHRSEAVGLINVCTTNLVMDSDYAKFMDQNSDKVNSGDGPVMDAAKTLFDKVVAEEKTLWNSMSKAAENKNPAGLCKMTVNQDKTGAYIEISGTDCK